jgi:hypothetical protein
MNTLAQRLKFAKRELTALKTAHIRGIGNLKIYSKTVSIIPESGHTLLNIIVKFSESSPKYPFVQVFGMADTATTYNYTILGGGYSEDGKTFQASGIGLIREGKDLIYVESTSPINDVEYYWGE